MSSLPLIKSDSGPYLDSLVFTLGKEAPARGEKSIIPARRAGRHCAPSLVHVYGAMTLTARVDDLMIYTESYSWCLYLHYWGHLRIFNMLSGDRLLFPLSGVGLPRYSHFDYID